MVKDKKNIVVFIRKLNSLLFFAKGEYHAAIKDSCFVQNNYVKDIVDENILIQFIIKSIFCPSFRLLMPDILYCIDEHSITDKVFNLCIKYPGHYRNTLLSLLAHMWLTQEQLYKLNYMIDTPEAFCKLLVLFAENNSISVSDFTAFLEDNSKYIPEVDVYGLILNYTVTAPSEKIAAVKQMIERI